MEFKPVQTTNLSGEFKGWFYRVLVSFLLASFWEACHAEDVSLEWMFIEKYTQTRN